jgi:anaphase-promoting complex subunit 10
MMDTNTCSKNYWLNWAIPRIFIPRPTTRLSRNRLLFEVHRNDILTVDIDPSGVPASTTPPAPPPGLKEISSLANWTVSSSKPGCSVTALRALTTSLFWQSDGPQPHHLNIHFFKMVAIAGIRIYLDFDMDESYTPTLIRFAAGTGYNDLQEFSSMRFEQPRGWIDVDWEGVGDPADDEDGIDQPPILRCMLVQVRICENHQNGKDTHLRGLQIFAKDVASKSSIRQTESKPTAVLTGRNSTQPAKKRRNKLDLGGWLEPPVLR